MENQNSDDALETCIIYINCLDLEEADKPYFFLKYSVVDKRYRISTSFKYINIKFGLHINIARDFNKIPIDNLITPSASRIEFILELLNNHTKCSEVAVINTSNDSLIYKKYLDTEQQTEVFLVQREHNKDLNVTIVFFSSKWWSLADYLKSLIEKPTTGVPNTTKDI